MPSCRTSFVDLFKSGRFEGVDRLADARVFSADGQEFRVHKYFLSSGSFYFRALYRGNFKDEDIVLDFDAGTLENALVFLYTEFVSLCKDNVVELAVAADYLLIDRLLDIVRSFALQNLSLDNCVQFLTAGLAVERLGLAELCYRWVKIYFGRLVARPDSGIERLPLDALKRLLLDDGLGVSDERSAWDGVKRWLEHDLPTRQHHFPELVSRLRLTPANSDLAARIVGDPLVKANRGLEAYFEAMTGPEAWSVSGPQAPRCPRRLHVFLSNAAFEDEGRDASDVFVTYDERPDVWRRIAETEGSFDELAPAAGGRVVMLDTFSMPSANRVQVLDLGESTWRPLTHPKAVRRDYRVARCPGRIYVLGGFSFLPEVPVTRVDFYATASESWGEFAPLPAAFQVCGAAAVGRRVYVVGCREEEGAVRMKAVVGGEASAGWRDLPPPAVPRRLAAVVAYGGRVYALGGRREDDSCSTAAEVFDPGESAWRPFPDLPLPYLQPKAVELYERLIVYDDHIGNRYIPRYPPSIWNERDRSWTLVGPEDPLNDIHNYHLCTIDDFPTVSMLVEKNRKFEGIWEPTPFRFLKRVENKTAS